MLEGESTKTDPSKRKRRWFQFSLRTLMVFTLICAIACAWLGSKIERKRRERESVKLIEEMGGSAYYDYQVVEDSLAPSWSPDAPPSGPAWLRWLLGDDFFAEVNGVVLNHSEPSGNAKRLHLEELTQLEYLFLDELGSDALLADLKGLTRLKHLELCGATITDAGLQHLRALTKLEWLDVRDTKVTDVAVSDLQRALPNCEILHRKSYR